MESLGFHFGHDASAAHLDDHGMRRFLNKERVCRVKHALGLSSTDLRDMLRESRPGTPIGLSSTQDVPIFFDNTVDISIEGAQTQPARQFFDRIAPNHPYHRQSGWDPDIAARRSVMVPESDFYYETYANGGCTASYEALAMVGFADPVLNVWHRKTALLQFEGAQWPATFYQHHLLHAFYAAYAMSPTRPALIVTGDGGAGPSFAGGGVYLWTPPGDLQPVAPVDGWLGEFYTAVSEICGFDPVGGPGKLMGLAPYGRPIYVDPALVGTRRQITREGVLSVPYAAGAWLNRCDVDFGALSAWNRHDRHPPGLVADVAASAQAIVELNQVKLLRAAVAIARRCRHEYDAVLLCGGLALNCPANSVLNEVLPAPVLVPPAVNDEGLSIGAAVAAFRDQHQRLPAALPSFADHVYVGSCPTEGEIATASEALGWRIIAPPASMVPEAARRLAEGAIIGLCSGRSELGPRALGHRSILADPCRAEIWDAVNVVKRRESWRPFAPAVLLEDAAAWFDRGPAFSPFMLFNFRCLTKQFPAVTHYDHTARVQHVTRETGLLFDLLQSMRDLGRPPVLLNTSFNGPGSPIAESIHDALVEASQLGLSYVLTDFGLVGHVE